MLVTERAPEVDVDKYVDKVRAIYRSSRKLRKQCRTAQTIETTMCRTAENILFFANVSKLP